MDHPSRGNNDSTKGTKGKNRPASRKIVPFLFCLLISALMWLVISLQKNYQTVITIPFDYSGWNAAYVAEGDRPREISVEIEDKGLTLLSRQLFGSTTPIALPLTEKQIKRGVFTVSSTQLKQLVQEKLSQSTRIRDISPQSISLTLNKRHEKQVPVRPSVNVQPENGFRLVSISVDPVAVHVYGSQNTIDKIKNVYTDSLTLKGLKANKTVSIPLVRMEGVEYNTDKVTVEVHIEELTEQTYELPVMLLNVPANVHLRALPGRAQITVTMPISSYGKVSEDEFELAVDWNKINPDDSTLLLPIEVIKKPEIVDRYRLTPEKVQYIIEEKQAVKQ